MRSAGIVRSVTDNAPFSILSGIQGDAAAPAILERLVQCAEGAGASDIHLQMRGAEAEVSFRLDGLLTPAARLPSGLAERVFGRVKFLARLKTYQDSMPQDGRIDKAELGARSDLRVATYPTVTGEKLVLRLFTNRPALGVSDLGFPEPTLAELRHVLNQTTGLLLLTGPAGTGKTTTIYGCLRHLAAAGTRHIITIEDPVEQVIPGIMQTEAREAQGLDFAKAARHLLRQDPQVLVIGEIRDEETATIALRAALTGHLVIATLHAGSCQGVLERLQALSRDAASMAASIALILNQRLLRAVCASCTGKGCTECLGTGFRGRLPLVEWLRIDARLRNRIHAGDFTGISAQPSLAEQAEAMVQSGKTLGSEVERVLGRPSADRS